MDSWLDGTDIDKYFGPGLHLLFKMHEIWSGELLKLLPPDVRF